METDSTTEENRWRTPTTAPSEIEVSTPLEEKIPLLGKEKTEPRQVDLPLIDFDLSEIGIHGEIGSQVLGDTVLHVESGVGIRVVLDRRTGVDVGP